MTRALLFAPPTSGLGWGSDSLRVKSRNLRAAELVGIARSDVERLKEGWPGHINTGLKNNHGTGTVEEGS